MPTKGTGLCGQKMMAWPDFPAPNLYILQINNVRNGKNKTYMNMIYEDVLERLKAERLTHELSQTELSRQLKIT